MPLAPLSINNPILGFRLDPGEPGLLSSAPASQATLRVTAQEQRNLNRLESDAIMRGDVIISSGISFGHAFAGKFLTTTNGLTTVVSRPARPSVIESEAAKQAGEPGRLAGAAPPDATDEPQGPRQPANDNQLAADDRALLSQADALRAELRRLETPGFGADLAGPNQFATAADGPQAENDPLRPLADAAARRTEAARDERAREVESELRKVEFERLMRQMGRGSAAAAATPEAPAPAVMAGVAA